MKGRVVMCLTGLVASAIVGAATLDASRPGPRSFEDGDTLLWGKHDGARCTGLCIRTERRGNTLVTDVHGSDGALAKTDTHALVAGGRAPIALSTFVSSNTAFDDGSTAPPAADESGNVSQSQPYTSGKTNWVQTTTFRYLRGALKDVEVTFVQYTVP